MRKYYPGITLFKIAGALLVLTAHIVLIPYMDTISSADFKFSALLLRVVVPCFYLISGFLAYKGWSHAADSAAYVKKYALRIFFLYGFFCLIYIADTAVPALVRGGSSLPHLLSVGKETIRTFLLRGPDYQLWFIPPLIVSVLAAYWFCEGGKGRLRAGWIAAAAGFTLSQIGGGTLLIAYSRLETSFPALASNRAHFVYDMAANYLGYGFPFVLAGVLLARREEAFLRSGRKWLMAALAATALESILLLTFASWNEDYMLAFCLLPNSILLFYGVLKLKANRVQAHHAFLNIASMVIFFAHILLLKLNLLIIGWKIENIGLMRSWLLLALTFGECMVLTWIFMYRRNKSLSAKRAFAATDWANQQLAE